MPVAKQLYCLCVLIILASTSLPVSGQSATTRGDDIIIAQENAFWKAYVANDAASLTDLLSTDFINVEEQRWNRNQVLKFLQVFHEGHVSEFRYCHARIPRGRVAYLRYELNIWRHEHNYCLGSPRRSLADASTHRVRDCAETLRPNACEALKRQTLSSQPHWPSF